MILDFLDFSQISQNFMYSCNSSGVIQGELVIMMAYIFPIVRATITQPPYWESFGKYSPTPHMSALIASPDLNPRTLRNFIAGWGGWGVSLRPIRVPDAQTAPRQRQRPGIPTT